MQAVQEIIARAVPLDRSDVDTDQIIPSDWLKRVERTGFGEGLFSEWRERSDFVLNQDRFRDIFRNNCLKVGLVPVELPQDVVTRIMRTVEDDSSVEIVIDVVDRRVAIPPIELDDHTHHRLLHGLDDIGLTLQRGDEIASYEAGRPEWLPKVAAGG